MSRVLGVDYGERRLGFALSDEAQIIALPLGVIVVDHPRQARLAVERLIREKQVGRVVLGMPLNLNGTRGPAAAAVEHFMEQLRTTSNVPLETWDERLSSQAAERVLIAAGTRRAKRKTLTNQLAAQIMLQSYLDARQARGHNQDALA